VSSSVAFCESELTPADVALADWELLSLAAVGVPVVAAAGDNGSSGCHPTDDQPIAMYPASSPFALAVGGTQLGSGGVEAVWNDGTLAGGGASSALVARPAYQDDVVAGAQRSVPDLAVVAAARSLPLHPVCDETGSCPWVQQGGTSASAPLVAAGLMQVRQAVERRGGRAPTLWQPLLYRLAGGSASPFADVADGTNDLYDVGCCPATVGFDGASGWGAVDFARLAEAMPTPLS
jgi:kumamolisin